MTSQDACSAAGSSNNGASSSAKLLTETNRVKLSTWPQRANTTKPLAKAALLQLGRVGSYVRAASRRTLRAYYRSLVDRSHGHIERMMVTGSYYD